MESNELELEEYLDSMDKIFNPKIKPSPIENVKIENNTPILTKQREQLPPEKKAVNKIERSIREGNFSESFSEKDTSEAVNRTERVCEKTSSKTLQQYNRNKTVVK